MIFNASEVFLGGIQSTGLTHRYKQPQVRLTSGRYPLEQVQKVESKLSAFFQWYDTSYEFQDTAGDMQPLPTHPHPPSRPPTPTQMESMGRVG